MAQKYEPSSNENSSFADQSFDDSSFKNNNDLHPLGIRLSYSVDTASKNLAPNATYPAWVFAYEILKSHSDYVTTLYAQIFNPIKKNWEIFVKETNNVQKASEAKALSAADWLLLVKSILNTNVVKELHGRVTIIALSLLDEELFSLLNKENYLQKLSEEVKEKMTDVFIPDAYKVFKRKVLKEKEATDSVSNKTDNPLNIKDQDKLDRYAFAEFIVELLNKINDQYCAYTLHLYAPWGAGKTSTLNFMKQIMKKGGEEDVTWHIVDFNAWQNQHLEYPWWNMMDSIYKQVWKRLLKSPLKFINEFRWRLNSQKLNYFFALSVIMWIIFSLIVPVLKNSENVVNDMGALFEKLEKTVGGILAIWALVLGIGKFIAGGQTRSAELYLASKKDPMNSFQKRFKNIIEGIKPGRVAVFIDDLDRCKSSYVISLLESLQTLFNYQNVFFIIAADKKWINACYEVEYQSIKSYIGTTGKPIGNLFIEKMFQQSIALPGVHKEMKEKLWDSLLSVDKQEITETDESIVKEMQNAGSLQETEEIIARSKEGSFATEHAVRLQAIKKITKKQNLEETEHLLKPYANLLDLNPRSMKRLINNYSAIKASSIISHIDIPTHQTVLWAILTMRWPIVAEYILEHAALSKGSINVKNGNLPAEINHLFKDEELINLLNGGGHKDGPLVANTVIQCRQLFI